MDEQDSLLEDNAFNGIEEVVEETPPENTEEQQIQEVVESTEENPEYAQITKSELEALMQKAARIDDIESKLQSYWDRSSGTLGELKQRLEKQNKPAFNPEKIKTGKVAESFGDDFASELANDLAEAIGIQESDPVDFDSKISSAVQEMQYKFDLKLLNALQPGWKKTIYSNQETMEFTPEFKKFFDALPENERLGMTVNFDPEFTAEKIGQFKSQQKPVEKLETKVEKPNPRASRIAAAVTPKSAGTPVRQSAMSEEDAFNSA